MKKALYLVLILIVLSCDSGSANSTVSLVFSLSAFSQSEKVASIETVELYCGGDTLSVHVPTGYLQMTVTNFMEGTIQSFIYEDKSSISILCGSNAILQVNPEGYDELFSRRIKFHKHDIIYENVSEDMRAIFDIAFDKMENESLHSTE